VVEDALGQGWPETLERGVAGTAITGEERSGDLAVFAGYEGGGLVAVIDGLGHGDPAADASAVAADVIRRHRSAPPDELLQRCHEALRKTRGAALSLAAFSASRRDLTWIGVGNVEGRLVRAAPVGAETLASLVNTPGTLGATLPPVSATTVPVERGDTVVFATDGVSRDFADELELTGAAQGIADRILREHGRDGDDALVVVARLLGGAR
jgi:negative regulator of sigma-B (phosphoserine phosphatase)